MFLLRNEKICFLTTFNCIVEVHCWVHVVYAISRNHCLKEFSCGLGMVVYTFNLSAKEAEVGGSVS